MEHTGWWPDYQLRFFKRGTVQWSDKVHTPPVAQGSTARFPAEEKYAIVHHNYQSVTQFIDRLNRYTGIQAKQVESKEVSGASVVNAFTQEFMRRLFVFEGIQDGVHGLSLSLMQAMYESIVMMKQWDEKHFSQTGKDQDKTLGALRNLQKSLGYWIADWHVKNSSGLTQVYWKVRRRIGF
jgi:hypothetical protein